MAQTAQIMCVNKNPREDRHHAIINVGGVSGGSRWKITQQDAIGKIERGEYTFYTLVRGVRADVVVATHSGRKYLKTRADYDTPDNLLSLDECP